MVKENLSTSSFLSRLKDLAVEFRAGAEEIDRGKRSPAENLRALAENGYYRFAIEANPGQRRRALDLLSAGCGVTAFLSTQHEGACRRLAEASHPISEQAVSGQEWVGVCFAHLRRRPSPVSAIRSRDRVVFSGVGPWFSGLGLMTHVLVGGATEDGEFLMSLASLDEPEITSRALEGLIVMEETATAGLSFNALSTSIEDLVVEFDAETLAQKDMHSTVFQSARSLGAARAAAEYLPHQQRQEVLYYVEQQHLQMDLWDKKPAWDTATQLRYQALRLADRVIGAAYTTVGGRAHLLSHPLQRIAREAHFYSTTQLTQQLRESMNNNLISDLQQTFGKKE